MDAWRMANRPPLLIGTMILLALAACSSTAPPPAPWPATVLAPLSSPAATDGRARFRAAFCPLVAVDPLFNQTPCDQWLQRLPDEATAAAAPLPPRPAGAPRFEILFIPGVFGECFVSGLPLHLAYRG